MKKFGLFYGASTVKTAAMAQKIKEAFGNLDIDLVPVEQAWEKEFEKYDHLIVGTATWFDGELPSYWDEMLPELRSLDLKGKTVAIFGLGDQVNYPENFVDGIGLLAETFEVAGATIVGLTSPDGYTYSHSRALRDGSLLGLAIDDDSQPEKTEERIKNWVAQLKKEGFSAK
ncbi:flavodoxin [uncultured Bacteroides sp.]|uniref:flavodoxin n=1 Tax=uncultured Bacteroides sp. TaxID=162156 RepID=UPI002AAA8FBB|nr:flavodoxin [uncultured Bacteroides sp.]